METDREIAVKETTDQESEERNTTENREKFIQREYGFASDVKLKECRYCRVMIPKKAKVCPNCRMDLKRHWFRNLVAAVFAVAVIGVGGYFLSEHWGIMRDAVVSVWMAQNSNAVPTVSVSTVGTEEVAAGAASTGTPEIAVNTETSGNKAAEEKAKSETETIRGNTVETGKRKEEDSMDVSSDISDKVQSKETDEKQADSDEKPAKESSESNADELTEDKAAEEKNAESKDTVSKTTSGKKSSDASDQEEEANQETAGETTSTERNSKQPADDSDEETDVASVKELNQQEQAFRDDCTEVSYKALLRDTETYLNTALKVEVQIVCQVMGGLFDENVYYLCKVEEVNGIERYYIIRDDRETDDVFILEGDTLTVYGQLFGNCKLPATLMETRPTVPAISMLYLDLIEE